MVPAHYGRGAEKQVDSCQREIESNSTLEHNVFIVVIIVHFCSCEHIEHLKMLQEITPQ